MKFIAKIFVACLVGLAMMCIAIWYDASDRLAIASYFTTAIAVSALLGVFDRKQLWVVSVFGAIAHNAGQLCVAAVVSGTGAVVSLAPYLLISAILTGVLTGLTAQRLWFSPLKRFANTK